MTVPFDCLHFKRKRSQKVNHATFCTKWKSALTDSIALSLPDDDSVVEVDLPDQPETEINALLDSDLFKDPDECGDEVAKVLANRVDLACTKKPAKDKLAKSAIFTSKELFGNGLNDL